MNRTGILLVVFALVGGAAIGYAVGVNSKDAPGLPPGVASAPPEPPPPTGLPPAPSAGNIGSLAQALDALPRPVAETGDGVILGVVLTADGRPLEGVLVRGTPRRPGPGHHSSWRRGGGAPEDRRLADVVRDVSERHYQRLLDRRKATTDENGRFRLTGLLDLEYSLALFLEGWEFDLTSKGAIRPGVELTYTAAPILTVQATVLMPDGSEPESARLSVSRQNSGSMPTWRPGDRAFQVAPGHWTISATSGPRQEYVSGKVDIVVQEGQTPAPIELRLVAIRGIYGRVVMPEGEERLFVSVRAVRIATGGKPDPALLEKSGQKARTEGPQREFTFRDLATGTWLVGVIVNARDVVGFTTVEVGDGLSEVVLEIPEPKPEDYVTVTVLLPDGSPAEDVRFETSYRSESGNSSSGSRTRRLSDGTFRVSHHTPPPGYQEGGKFGITATVGGHGSRRVWYQKDGTSRLEIRFADPARLRVVLGGYVGSGLEGQLALTIDGVDAAGKSIKMSSLREDVDPEGTADAGPLAPGNYRVELRVKRDRWGHGKRVASASTTLSSGPNEVTIPVPKLYTLTVLIDESLARAQFTIRPRVDGTFAHSPVSPVSGKVVFEYLVAGEYEVKRYGGGGRKITVLVPAESEVRFPAR